MSLFWRHKLLYFVVNDDRLHTGTDKLESTMT
jgi:hypothetical protein